MTKQPIVSVIVPTRNSESTIDSCIKSIKAQTYPAVEIIVVDNSSTDKTEEIAQSLGAKYYAKPFERSASRNFGAKMATGKYVLFIDSDMILAPNVITDCSNVALKGNYGACIIREVTVGEGYWAEVRALERRTYEGGSVFETAIFFKKDVFLRLNGFNEKIVGFEDYDLQVRLEKSGTRIGYSNTPIFHNEEKLVLHEHLMKKRYYVCTGKAYIFENKSRSLTQFSPIKNVFLKNWRLLTEKPQLTAGLFLLKGLEVTVGALSLLC